MIRVPWLNVVAVARYKWEVAIIVSKSGAGEIVKESLERREVSTIRSGEASIGQGEFR